MQLVKGVAQVLVVFVVHREEAREDHRLGLAVARQGLCRGTVAVGQGLANAHGVGVFKARDHVANLAHTQLVHGNLGRALDAHAVDQEIGAHLHHAQGLALLDRAVKDAHRGNDAAVFVKVRIEDKGLERCVCVALGSRDQVNNGLEKLMDALAGLARDAHGVVCRDGQLFLDLFFDLVGVGRRQVDLVDRGHDVQVGVHGQRGVRDGLCLHALGGVDNQDRALTGCQRAADLVGKVDVAGRVDQVKLIRLAVIGVIGHAHGVGLDRDAAFALDVHRVQELRLHVALLDRVGELQDAVRDRRFTVVNVRNDREVADMRCICSSHRKNNSELVADMLYSSS